MAILTYPLNGIMYDAEDAEIYNCTRTSGVFAEDGHFPASVTGTREVSIGPGLAWMQNEEFHGKAVYNPDTVPLTIPEADAYQARIDRIVLRFDKLLNQTTLEIKTGTPASSPKAPDIERTIYIYELGLFTVSVKASTASVSMTDITSTIMDESVCGLMRDGVTRLPSQDLYDQWYTWFKEITSDTEAFEQQLRDWFEEFQDGAEEGYQKIIDEGEKVITDSQEKFDEWFENLEYVLDGDVAGHLQVEIEAAQEAADTALEQLATGIVNGYLPQDDDCYTLLTFGDDYAIVLPKKICSCSGSAQAESGTAVTQSQVDDAVDKYLETHDVQTTPVDATLTKSGEAADAKVVGDKLAELQDNSGSGSASTVSVKVGSTATGAAGTDAEVSNSGTDQNVVLNFTIPRGDQGEQGIQGEAGPQGEQGIQGEAGPQGEAGADGFSPTVEVSKSGKVTTITITDQAGPHSAEILDGEDGTGGGEGGTGADGYSPTVSVSKSDGVTTIVITDKNGDHTATINDGEQGPQGEQGIQGEQGPQGEKGDTGAAGADGAAATIKVGTVTTGAAGSSASVTNSGTANAAVFDFVIPQGEQGSQGEKGDTGATGAAGKDGTDGVSVTSVEQTTTSTESGGTNVITVTLSNGTKSTFNIKNGAKGDTGAAGSNGKDGSDGYTPVKGVDYFTADDIAEIVKQVVEQVTQIEVSGSMTSLIGF